MTIKTIRSAEPSSPSRKTREPLTHIAVAALAITMSIATSPAKADTYTTYDVNATYDVNGTVSGSFTLDTTTNASYLVDLSVVGVGGVNSGSYSDPTQFSAGTYDTAGGVMDTYNTENPALQIFLTYPAGGGPLYTASFFGEASIDSFFSPSCSNIVCGYTLDGTVTADTGMPSAAPEPATWALLIAGLGGVGVMLRRVRTSIAPRFKDATAA